MSRISYNSFCRRFWHSRSVWNEKDLNILSLYFLRLSHSKILTTSTNLKNTTSWAKIPGLSYKLYHHWPTSIEKRNDYLIVSANSYINYSIMSIASYLGIYPCGGYPNRRVRRRWPGCWPCMRKGRKIIPGGGYKGGGGYKRGGHGTSLGLFKKYFRPKLQFILETL